MIGLWRGFSKNSQSCQNVTVVGNDPVGVREVDTFFNAALDAQH
jgi:hypothetical protein